jgi:hypothetical protein
MKTRRRSRKNPISTTDWLIIAGLGALALGGGYLAYNTYQASSWPPSASAQQDVLNQILAANTQMGGPTPTAQQIVQIASLLPQASVTYAASLPAGTVPTTAGYQAWMSSRIAQYVAVGGMVGGFAGALAA